MNARREKDIMVGVISKKKFTENCLAELVADQIQKVFDLSRFSVVTTFAYKPKDFEGVVAESNILIIDKSLDHDLDGRDGIDFIKRMQVVYPHKMIMTMSSNFNYQERAELISSGVKLLLKKPVNLSILQKSVELCIKLIDLQKEIDHDLWKKVEY